MKEISKRARVIAAFPGMGKTHLFNNCKDKVVLDSDSSNFSWVVENGEKKRNPEFPSNYIKHIKENLDKCDIILVSSHEEVRNALIENEVYFELCYPSLDDKEIYIERYIRRGSPEAFINLISNNWDKWITDIDNMGMSDDSYCTKVQFVGNFYLIDYIERTQKMYDEHGPVLNSTIEVRCK